MQYIDGIPLITDPEGDAALFGSLFPQGFAQSQTAFQNMRRTPILDYEWQFLKRSVDDVHDAVFMLATPETVGNVTLQQEQGTQLDFRKEDFILYNEQGGSEGRYDKGIDVVLATISVIVLKDGVLAERLWKETEVQPNQAIFFIENNESDWSSAKMFARFGEFAKKKLLELDRGNSMLMEFLRSLPEVNNDVIQQLLNHGQVETKVSLVKKVVTGIMKIVSYAAGGPGKIVGPWCEKAGNYILENIQIPESVWNSQSDDYSKREKLQEKLMLGNDLSGLLASLNDSILLMPVRYVAPELLNRLKKGAEQFLAEFVAQYNSMVSDALKKMFGDTGSDEEPDLSFLREYTAYLCGICNGLIDFVGGTLVFAGQLMQFQFDFAQDADAYLERFDSFMASVKPFFAKILAAVKKAFANPKEYFSKFDTTDVNWDKVAYCAGYTAAFIASFFIPFAAFAKPAATAAKLKKGLAPAEMLADISSKTAKVSKFVMDGSRRAAGQMLEFLDDILKLMALGLEELTAFLEDIFKKMAEWLMKNKKVVESLAAKAKQLFAKESKADALFRDVTKILIKNKGVLNEKQFFKIAEQIKKHFGVDMFWIDRNSVKFAELFKKWQNRPIFACFHDHGFLNNRYGIFLDGPAIYFFKGFDKLGNLFEITAYTLQHELIHLKLWHKMNVEFKELAALYKKIPDVLHEADVIGTMLKQNKYGAAVKWSMDDILLDLKTLNDNIIQYPNWNKAAQKLFGKTELTLKDLEKWDISNYLNKI